MCQSGFLSQDEVLHSCFLKLNSWIKLKQENWPIFKKIFSSFVISELCMLNRQCSVTATFLHHTSPPGSHYCSSLCHFKKSFKKLTTLCKWGNLNSLKSLIKVHICSFKRIFCAFLQQTIFKLRYSTIFIFRQQKTII